MKWKVASICLLALQLGGAASARAESVFVQQLDDRYDDVAVHGFEFAANQTPSRAWVNLDVYRRDFSGLGEIDEYSVVRTYVTGLSRIDDRIVFTSGARATVCATVVHKRFLFVKYDRVEKTGRCTVTTRPGGRQKDDGFEVKTVPMLDVYLVVRE
jgi:hypothetical protein